MSAAPPFGHDAAFTSFLAALGRMNYAFSNTESLMIHVIAGLLGTDKEKATIVFLTLNTTRARLDLVERLAKLDTVSADLRADILGLTRKLAKYSPIRNQFNHCIYAFDGESGRATSIRMRVSDRKDGLKIGDNIPIDDEAIQRIDTATAEMHALNREVWKVILARGFPV